MEQTKSGALWNSPPYFDRYNYSYWKTQMMFFLKTHGEGIWNFVEYGWRPLLILDAQGRSTGELKLKNEWDKVNDEGSEANAKALFSIFNKVYLDEFHRIAIVNL